MSDRWCDDCAWPEECAAEVCCRRREAGEIRSAAPSETAAKIERSLPFLERDPQPRRVIRWGGQRVGRTAALATQKGQGQ